MSKSHWISLSKGKYAIIDADDLPLVGQYKWHASRNTNSKIWYARCCKCTPQGTLRLALHRFVLGVTDPRVHVDHKNHQGLDCRKHNLRICTVQQNHANERKTSRTTSSQYKGVSYEKKTGHWLARIRVHPNRISLGSFKTEVEAAVAYNEAALRFHGEFACLNKIDLGENYACNCDSIKTSELAF